MPSSRVKFRTGVRVRVTVGANRGRGTETSAVSALTGVELGTYLEPSD